MRMKARSLGINTQDYNTDKIEKLSSLFTGIENISGDNAKVYIEELKNNNEWKEVKVKNPIDAMHLGMGLLPDDRKAEGIVADLSVRENIILAIQAKQGILKRSLWQNSVRLQTSILIFSRSMCKPWDLDQTAFRWKPAEGYPCKMACNKPRFSDSGRAYPRNRYRYQDRDPEAGSEACRWRKESDLHFLWDWGNAPYL